MVRGIAPLFALLALLTACGGGESSEEVDGGSSVDSEASTPASGSDAGAEPESDTGGDSTNTDTGADTGSDSTDTNDTTDTVTSFDDIPDRCRDLFAEFLRDIEPLVADIDWQAASAADLTSVQGQFGTLSNEFEVEVAAESECAGIDLDDGDFEQTIAFAREVAPGTVGFWEFLRRFGSGGDLTGGSTGDDTVPGLDAEEFADCAEAVTFVEDLIADYDSVSEIPISELTRLQSLAPVIATCSPEQTAALTAAMEAFTP